MFSVLPGYLTGKGVSGHVLEVSESNLCLLSIVKVRDARFEEVPGVGSKNGVHVHGLCFFFQFTFIFENVNFSGKA